MDNLVKILFEIPSPENNDEVEIESIWAENIHGDRYRIDNIPFYVRGYSLNDVVIAELRHGALYATNKILKSEHNTVRVYFFDDSQKNTAIQILQTLGCSVEISDNPDLVAVDVPPSISYSKIKEYLEQGEAKQWWEYEEGCLNFLVSLPIYSKSS